MAEGSVTVDADATIANTSTFTDTPTSYELLGAPPDPRRPRGGIRCAFYTIFMPGMYSTPGEISRLGLYLCSSTQRSMDSSE